MAADAQPIKIAILAMGGEGGGVLADWIVDLGEAHGHIAQTTSVAGVAQRTGATIYYLELFPRAAAEAAGAAPVLALIPTPGDVDVLIASELMEAGRAVQRGLVTKDRTTLIASTHRVYAIAEKTALGDGTADSAALEAACLAAAQRFIRFDMAAAAERSGSVISAVLFGALCASATLPFGREAFEATIRAGGVGVEASLRAFAEGLRLSLEPPPPAGPAERPVPAMPPTGHAHPAVDALLKRVHGQFSEAARPWLGEGLRRTVDYQDPAYGALYLERMARIAAAGNDELTRGGRAPPGAVDGLRGHRARGRPEAARRPLPARAQRGQGGRRAAAGHPRVPAPAAAGDLRHAARGPGPLAGAIGRAAAAGRALHPARAASCRPARCAAT